MSTLERAIEIAACAHSGQTDKAGEAYILHPLRVMFHVTTNDERIVAALHDVVEDCPEWPLSRLREEGFSAEILAAVDALTKRDGEDYEAFVRRAGANPLARRVKIADVTDNSNMTRIADPSQRDNERLKKYRRAMEILNAQ